MAIALDTLAYARRLREAGFSVQQAEGQADALAAAMTDTLAPKQDVRELETRMDAKFAQVDTRLTEFEKRVEIRFSEQSAHLDGALVAGTLLPFADSCYMGANITTSRVSAKPGSRLRASP